MQYNLYFLLLLAPIEAKGILETLRFTSVP
jgi:hypothetical protein